MLSEFKKIREAYSFTKYEREHVIDIKAVHRVRKRYLRLLILLTFVVVLFQRSSWPLDSWPNQILTRMGILLLAIAVGGRSLVWIHLGRRKHETLVFDG